MANGFGVGSRRRERIPPPPCPSEHPASPFPELWRGPGVAPSPPCSAMPSASWPRCQHVGGTMRRRFPDFELGQEVGAAGTAPSWARHPCPMPGAARGAVAEPGAVLCVPGLQAGLPLAHPGTAPGHGDVSPLPISPPFSTTRFSWIVSWFDPHRHAASSAPRGHL